MKTFPIFFHLGERERERFDFYFLLEWGNLTQSPLSELVLLKSKNNDFFIEMKNNDFLIIYIVGAGRSLKLLKSS